MTRSNRMKFRLVNNVIEYFFFFMIKTVLMISIFDIFLSSHEVVSRLSF